MSDGVLLCVVMVKLLVHTVVSYDVVRDEHEYGDGDDDEYGDVMTMMTMCLRPL